MFGRDGPLLQPPKLDSAKQIRADPFASDRVDLCSDCRHFTLENFSNFPRKPRPRFLHPQRQRLHAPMQYGTFGRNEAGKVDDVGLLASKQAIHRPGSVDRSMQSLAELMP